MRRGLTMIELLVALGLLSAVMLAVVSWTQVMAQTSQHATGPVRWRSAAEAVLRLIHDDLVSGDLVAARKRGTRDKPRIQIVDGVLQINTRAVDPAGTSGPVVHRYALEVSSRALRREQRTLQGPPSSRLLLDDVLEWQCAVDEEEQVLRVSVTSQDQITVARTYLLP